MQMSFHDLETFSNVPIRCGTWAYAEKAEVLLWAYAMEREPIKVWDVASGAPMPAELAAMLADDDVVTCWHNGGMFDTVILKVAMGIDLPLRRVHDTLVQALAHSLPGSLDALCTILRIDADKAKDKAGRDLIRLFCVPIAFRFPHKREAFRSKAEYDLEKALAEAQWQGRATAETHPAEWAKFIEYARQDIAAAREAYFKMPRWNLTPTEVKLWHVDQAINRRGMLMDVELAECAVNAVAVAQEELRERTVQMTGGEVESATRRDAMLAHILTQYGIDLPDLRGATLERRIADPDLPDGLRELLRVRLQACTTSTSKYKALLGSVSSDGRLRGTKQFCGAGRTGRWAGRIFQPDNLPSRGLLPQAQIEDGIEALKGGYAHLTFPDVMHLASSAIRGCIIAPPRKKLVVADLSNIEGRVAAWLAGESWKLKAFRDFDAGTGHDLYILAYAKAFGVDPGDVEKPQRQIGKVMELALQFEGGVGAFTTMAAGYGFDLDAMADAAQPSIPGDVWGQSNIMLQWHRDHGRDPAAALKLRDKTWLVCESFVLGWRAGHANIKAYWKELDTAVRNAIQWPGQTFPCGHLKARRDGAWLRIVLPSGRALCYPSPALVPEKRKNKLQEWEAGDEPVEDGGRTIITYMGTNQYTRKWERITTYSGKLYENAVQATARDVMAHNMPTVDESGYAILLTVHDEIITEAPDTDEFSADHLSELLAANPPWAPDMPLAAAGFEAYRYKKD